MTAWQETNLYAGIDAKLEPKIQFNQMFGSVVLTAKVLSITEAKTLQSDASYEYS